MPDQQAPFSWGEFLPSIDGGTVTLRRLVHDDVPDVFAVFSDPEVMRYWDGMPMTSLADAEAYVAAIDEGFRSRTLFQWGIALPQGGRVIGTCTLLRIAAPHGRGEIGFALGRPYWSRGYGSAAVAALVRFAFTGLALHRLEADVDPRNDRSLRLLERLGFVREGYLRERYRVGSDVQDSVVLGLLRREWTADKDAPHTSNAASTTGRRGPSARG